MGLFNVILKLFVMRITKYVLLKLLKGVYDVIIWNLSVLIKIVK
jgi:hypothetical protein